MADMYTTPETDSLIRTILIRHSEENMDDIDHYMDMCAVLAGHARNLERRLNKFTYSGVVND